MKRIGSQSCHKAQVKTSSNASDKCLSMESNCYGKAKKKGLKEVTTVLNRSRKCSRKGIDTKHLWRVSRHLSRSEWKYFTVYCPQKREDKIFRPGKDDFLPLFVFDVPPDQPQTQAYRRTPVQLVSTRQTRSRRCYSVVRKSHLGFLQPYSFLRSRLGDGTKCTPRETRSDLLEVELNGRESRGHAPAGALPSR